MRKRPNKPSQPDVPRPRKVKPAAGAPLNKKAAARAAGDAARAAGVIDDFARNRTPAAKPTVAKPAQAPASAPAADRTTAAKPARPGSRPGRQARPEPLELSIARLDDEGIGIARHEGKEVLVAGAFPGETVRVKPVAAGQRRIVGQLVAVVTRHPERIVPPCPCAGDCQGCPLIALSYPAQLRFKEEKVRSALARPGLRELTLHPAWGAEQPLGCRSSVKLAISRVRGKARIGLYRRGSHEVVDGGDCPLHHPLINRIVAVVRAEVTRQEIHSYDPLKRRGLLRYLAVRVSPEHGKAMVTFVVAERDFRQLPQLAKGLMRQCPEVISVQQNINTSGGNVIFGRETVRLLGVDDLLDQVGEVRLRLSPTSFFQVNHQQAARIYALVRQWAALGPQDTALDLYCGIGGIALHLALDAGRVIGVEAVEEAVKNARENARLNGRGNCVFYAGDVAEQLEELENSVAPGSVVVLNPPRGGCAPEVLKQAAALQPRRIVYVSCNPETLGRDLEQLHGLGYLAHEAQPVDMFPQTAHIETVVRLEPLPPKPALTKPVTGKAAAPKAAQRPTRRPPRR